MVNKALFSLLSIFITANISIAQNSHYCGTQLTDSYNELRSQIDHTNTALPKTGYTIPVQVHIVRYDNAIAGLNLSVLNQAFTDLNAFYAPMNVSFEMCNAINYIDDTDFHFYDASEEDFRVDTNDVLQQLNIFFTGELMYEGSSICAYASFPEIYDEENRKSNRLFVKNSCANGNILAHEIGHFFGLLHTHEIANGYEFVSGVNCSTAGDGFCDTPADPNLVTGVNGACQYIGGATDFYGDPYQPIVENLMSYSGWDCTESFTLEQAQFVITTIENERSYLACNGVYTATYNCTDWFEPNEQLIDAPIIDIYNSWFSQGDSTALTDLCLPIDDVDWFNFKVDSASYFVKVIGVNGGFGAYTLEFINGGDTIYVETKQRNMLDHDTKIFLYDAEMNLLGEDDNSGLGTYSKIAFDLNATPVTGLLDLNTLSGVNVFPNPVKDKVNIILPENVTYAALSIYNALGQLILNQNLYEAKTSINMSNYEGGLYFLRLNSKEGNYTHKIFK